jgi:hypothetical protein
MFWGSIFGWIGVELPKELTPVLSFLAFVSTLIIGVNLSSDVGAKSVKLHVTTALTRGRRAFVVGIILYLGINSLVVVAFAIAKLPPQMLAPVGPVISMSFTMAYLLYITKTRSWVIISSVLFGIMSLCVLILPLYTAAYETGLMIEVMKGLSVVTILPVCWMAVILFSPLQQLTRRLGFVVLGVLTLVALSEISKLNLHQYLKPAKVSEISSPTYNLPSHAAA